LAIVRKNLYTLLEICNKNSGRIVNTREALDLFGYSKTTHQFHTTSAVYFVKTIYRLDSFINILTLAYQLGNWFLTDERLASDPHMCHHKQYSDDGFFHWYFQREKLYLYPKASVSWWKLKDYGGKL